MNWRPMIVAIFSLGTFFFSFTLEASSHREAPYITQHPQVDGADFYLFRSYEPGREGFVTLIANYYPLQDPQGGPNYFALNNKALYEIHIDNNGDAVEDITFQFRATETSPDLKLTISGVEVSVPVLNLGSIGGDAGDSNLNRLESYSLNLIRGDRRTGVSSAITHASSGSSTFRKPVDNIGSKSFTDYAAYANGHIYEITIPECSNGRLFVGQRKDPFPVALGKIFDLINLDPLGARDAEANVVENKNITSFILEVPISCLTAGGEAVIGAWTTTSLRQARVINPAPDAANNKPASIEGGAWTQVSRLAHPLVNELIIGLKDKNRFNTSEPKDDGQFATYVTHPTLPAIIEILFGVTAPTTFPRSDLVNIFLLGLDGVNRPTSPVASEQLRLNTSIPVTAQAAQNNLGLLAADNAGYPNGRRPGDDVVDIVLRAAMGVLLPEAEAPSGQLPYTDGTAFTANTFDPAFPYLLTPLSGSK